ncbi:MAG: T9SS type A sorting domain-containing protein [Bacteroidales bacterium]|nr:T9SS type A sorting domain-containing protein [Bacteroidales bacterium]
MRTFTKLCLLAMVLTFSTALFAQQSIHNQTGNSVPDKMELLRQIHGPGVVVPPSIEGSSKAAGDDCVTPIEILSLPFTDAGQTTTGRGNDYWETCLNDFDGGEDIIYELELTSATTIQIMIDPKGTIRTGVAISDGCPLSSTCLGLSYDFNSGAPHGFTVALDAGIYYIMVDTWPNPASIPDFDLTVVEAATVANDDCEDAIDLGEVLNYPFSTELATDSPYGNTNGPEIWFNYTAGFTGWAAIDLCGSEYDTDLAVWEGAACPPVTLLDENDDYCGYDGLQSKIFLEVVQGEVYKIEIGGFDGATGDGLLSIYEYEICTLTCPPGGTPEAEPCGANINGGCNMDMPAFTSVEDGTIICGNLWSQFGTRDTDWFKVELASPGSIKMNVKAEESVVFGLVGQVVPGIPGCDNTTNFLTTYKILPGCQEDFIYVVNMPKGTYYLFVAPMDFFAHSCPGFNYQASFELVELASGFITGNVLGFDIAAGIEGVKITAGDAVAYTNGIGNYIIELPVGTYDVEANGYDAGYETLTVTDVVVLEDDYTTLNFILEPLPAPVLLTATPDIEQVELTWEPISAKQDGSKTLMGDIFSKNDYIPGTTMDLNFTMTIYSPDFEWGVYAEMVFPAEFVPQSAGMLNGVPGVVDGQKVSWTGLFYETSAPEELDFSVEVEVDLNAEGPLVVSYYVEGDGYGLNPHYFEGALTVYEDGGEYVPTFNVYRRKIIPGTTTYFIPIAYGVIGNYYLDEIFPGGDEWCYLVKQILPDKSESPASNILCAVPVIRPGSLCDEAIDYGQVNDPAISESLVRAEDERWFEFDVPYTMDFAVTLDNLDFEANVTLYADCDGTVVFDNADYCGGGSYDLIKMYDMVPGGTYYAKVTGLNGYFGSFDIFITQVQILTIREGWSGFSTYMDPSGDLSIASQLDCIKEDMIITVRQQPYGIWWPSQNLNTIGNIYNTFGYKAKMEAERTTIIFGAETPDKTVELPAGASYLPVRVTAPTPTSDILAQLNGELLILFDINTNEVIWPDGGLFLLDYLTPDHAYLINMFVPSSYTYPVPTMAPAPTFVYPPAEAKLNVWNEVANTGTPHFISIHKYALSSLETGDFIGVFDGNNICVGMAEYVNPESNLFIAAFGDDEVTEVKDGLTVGEGMTFKLFRLSTNTEYELEVTYDAQFQNTDGTFQVHGMSMISELKVGSTSISDGYLSSVAIYPNPTTGLLNISGIEGDVNIILSNVQGQQILTTTANGEITIDLSAQPRGVYFIRLTNETSSRIEKVVLK